MVKSFLHIPSKTSTHFLNAKTKDGGLGLMSCRERIATILHNRLKNLRMMNIIFTNAALNSTHGLRIEKRILKMIKGKETKEIVDRYHAAGLETSYSGNGLWQGNWSSFSGFWIDNPPSFWSGYDYVNAIKLKCNMLPTRGLPYNSTEVKKCRGGCVRIESLCHVLQKCQVTHWKRINRHDRSCQIIKEGPQKKNFTVDVEPKIRGDDGILRKPDLITNKEDSLTIVDVDVHWEGPNSLSAAYENKKRKYSTVAFLNACKKLYNVSNVTLSPFNMGARGVCYVKNRELADLLQLTINQRTSIMADTIKGSVAIHRDFGTRVWNGENIVNRR